MVSRAIMRHVQHCRRLVASRKHTPLAHVVTHRVSDALALARAVAILWRDRSQPRGGAPRRHVHAQLRRELPQRRDVQWLEGDAWAIRAAPSLGAAVGCDWLLFLRELNTNNLAAVTISF